MSLLTEQMVNCMLMDKTTVADWYGGYTTTYKDGAPFKAAVVLDNSTEARLAMQEGVTAVYTVTTTKALNLQYHDVFRRETDKKYFRVKSDGDDKKTPESATLNMRQVSAEEWSLTNE